MLILRLVLPILLVLNGLNVLNGLWYCDGRLFAFPHPSCGYTSSADSLSAKSSVTASGPSVFFCQGMTFTFPHPACQYTSKSDNLASRQVIVGTPVLAAGTSGGYSGTPIVIPGIPVTTTTISPTNPVAIAIALCIAQGNVPAPGCTFTTGQIQPNGVATCGQTCETGPF
ncbi:hypothetical protein RvY_14982 [Ramazzottius varieornatus]|uniref:Uncharacterized protein n=1 Tax=Ramazzottius varieornatus TaxID=947166 RepID=A0A1D1VT95_RAMVA|nr:hypothetical protein RvY_14982 [Ramazzottius varieornatus]